MSKVLEESRGAWLALTEFAFWQAFDSGSRAIGGGRFRFRSFESGAIMRNLFVMTAGVMSLLVYGVSSAQYGNMMGGGTWGGGWMGYGGSWIPILLVAAVAGLVGWIIGRKGK
jgi:hypothetical protein